MTNDDSPSDRESASNHSREDANSDPFADLEDAASDREGDPFESLAPEDEAGTEDEQRKTTDGQSKRETPDGSTRTSDPDDGQETPPDSSTTGSAWDTESPGASRPDGRDDPFESLDSGAREGDPFETFEGAGDSPPSEVPLEDQPDVDIDDESVWEDLSNAAAAGIVSEERGQRHVAEVSKHSFCKNCEYFSEPPAVHCTHEGTEILEFLDMDTVRVVDCPVVEERERIAESE